MTFYDESNMALHEWWNTLVDDMVDSIDNGWNETNMTSYGENLDVEDYKIVDFYDRNTTVSYFFWNSLFEQTVSLFVITKSVKF